MPKPRQSGQTGGKPPGPKQDQMPINHARSQKDPGVQNHVGGSHPAARRALGAKASAHAVSRTHAASTPGSATSGPGAAGANTSGNLYNQDSIMSQSNAMDQDAGLSQGSDFNY